MGRLIEHDIIQNVGLGALILHKFVSSYVVESAGLQGPGLAATMPILPLLYHQKTLDNIYNRKFEGGFFNAVVGYREIPAGLQQRMEEMSDQTFQAINLACQTDIVTYNKVLNELLPGSCKVNTTHYNKEIRSILGGAERLGFWFSTLPFEQICIMLKIKF